jgi:hypothetical protein
MTGHYPFGYFVAAVVAAYVSAPIIIIAWLAS